MENTRESHSEQDHYADKGHGIEEAEVDGEGPAAGACGNSTPDRNNPHSTDPDTEGFNEYESLPGDAPAEGEEEEERPGPLADEGQEATENEDVGYGYYGSESPMGCDDGCYKH